MKKVAQLIKEGNKSPIPTKIDNLEPHKLNLNMNYRGGKRGRKSEAYFIFTFSPNWYVYVFTL